MSIPRITRDHDAEGAMRQTFTRFRHDAQATFRAATGTRLNSRVISRAATGGSIFVRRGAPSPDQYDVHILVDGSGSMAGGTDRVAGQAAATVAGGLAVLPNVRTRVWYHSGYNLTDAWDSRDHTDPAENISANGFASGGNADGTILAALGEVVLSERSHRERSVIIAITDGLANESTAFVRTVVDGLNQKGVTVLSLAVVPGLDSAQNAMFGEENVISTTGYDWWTIARAMGERLQAMAR